MLTLIFISFKTIAGTEIQNGGTGLSINGKVATYYSSKITIEPIGLIDFEELTSLIAFIKTLSIDTNAKDKMLRCIKNSTERKYFKVQSSDINNDEVKKIIEEYKTELLIRDKDVRIFGITNINTSSTLLFPDFFQLSKTEKMTILFHESMWLSGKISNIREMLKLEYAFQAYLENNSIENEYAFYSEMGNMFNNKSWLIYKVFHRELDLFISKNPTKLFIQLDKLISINSTPALAQFIKHANYNLNYVELASSKDELIFSIENDEWPKNEQEFRYTQMALIEYLRSSVGYSMLIAEINDPEFVYKNYQNLTSKIIDRLKDAQVLISNYKVGESILVYDFKESKDPFILFKFLNY